MIRSLAWFPSQCALNSRPVMAAVVSACSANKIQVKENSLDADAVMLWSVLWSGRMAQNQSVYQHYRDLGRPVLIVEVGVLHRNITWRIALDHINAQGYFGNDHDIDADRPRRMNIKLSTPKHQRDEILIAAQHHRSLQLANIDSQENWINQQIQMLRQYTDRPIMVRSHPRSALDQSRLLPGVQHQTPMKVPGTYDDFDMKYDYHAVVNYCSGPGIQAAITGVRPVVSELSLAWPVSQGHADIEQPYDRDREKWLIEIAHTEYNIDEIKQGLWLKRLSDRL